jgi:hypothetical protein
LCGAVFGINGNVFDLSTEIDGPIPIDSRIPVDARGRWRIDADGMGRIELASVGRDKPAMHQHFIFRGKLLPRKLELIPRLDHAFMPVALTFADVELPMTDSLGSAGVGKIEGLDLNFGGDLHEFAGRILRDEDDHQSIVAGLAVEIRAAGHQAAERDAGHLKAGLHRLDRDNRRSFAGQLRAQVFGFTAGDVEFGFGTVELGLIAGEQILLLAEPRFEHVRFVG